MSSVASEEYEVFCEASLDYGSGRAERRQGLTRAACPPDLLLGAAGAMGGNGKDWSGPGAGATEALVQPMPMWWALAPFAVAVSCLCLLVGTYGFWRRRRAKVARDKYIAMQEVSLGELHDDDL